MLLASAFESWIKLFSNSWPSFKIRKEMNLHIPKINMTRTIRFRLQNYVDVKMVVEALTPNIENLHLKSTFRKNHFWYIFKIKDVYLKVMQVLQVKKKINKLPFLFMNNECLALQCVSLVIVSISISNIYYFKVCMIQ